MENLNVKSTVNIIQYFRNIFEYGLKLKRRFLFHQTANRVHFNVDQNDVKTNSVKPGKLTKSHTFVSTYGLKRSKSLNSDVLAAKAFNIADASELGKFPSPVQDILLRAIEGNRICLLSIEYIKLKRVD